MYCQLKLILPFIIYRFKSHQRKEKNLLCEKLYGEINNFNTVHNRAIQINIISSFGASQRSLYPVKMALTVTFCQYFCIDSGAQLMSVTKGKYHQASQAAIETCPFLRFSSFLPCSLVFSYTGQNLRSPSVFHNVKFLYCTEIYELMEIVLVLEKPIVSCIHLNNFSNFYFYNQTTIIINKQYNNIAHPILMLVTIVRSFFLPCTPRLVIAL